MKNKKSIMLTVAVILSLTLAMAGCEPKNEQKVPKADQTAAKSEELRVAFTSDYINKDIATSFRVLHPKVKVTVEKPASYEEVDAFSQKMFAEIMAGNGPDVLIMDRRFYRNNDITKMMYSGAFADIASYFEADKEYKAEDYNQNVMNMGVVDGKRYVAPLFYNIPMFTTTESIMEATGFNPDNCTDFYSFIDEAMKASSESGITAINQSIACDPLRYFFQTLGIDFLDYEQKSVSLGEDFKKAAEAVKMFGKNTGIENDAYIHGTEVEALRNQQTILAETSHFSFAMTLKDVMVLDQYDQTAVMLSLRDENGKIHGAFHSGAAVLSNSKNKQNAYDFIKLALSLEHQEEQENVTFQPAAVPVNNEAVEKVLARMSKPQSVYNSEMGNVIFRGLTDKEIAQYRGFLKDVVDVRGYNHSFEEMCEILESYFKDEISYDQAKSKIENIMGIYISE